MSISCYFSFRVVANTHRTQMGDIFTVTRSMDPRLVQPAQSFCAAQGASSVSIIPVAAGNQSTSNLVFTVIPPSPQVVCQKAPLLDLTLTFQALVCQSDGSGTGFSSKVAMNPYFQPFAVWGRDIGIGAAFPLGRLVSAYNIQINNAAVQQQNVPLPDLTHLYEGPKGRAGHATMSRTPLTASWDDSAGTLWGLDASGSEMLDTGDVGPGVYNVVYCNHKGEELDYSTTLKFYDLGNQTTPTLNSVYYQYGRPVTHPSLAGRVQAIFVKVRLVDPLVCSPWCNNYDRSYQETGLYGISAMTVQMQLSSASAARILQGSTRHGAIFLAPVQQADGTRSSFLPQGFTGQSGDLLPLQGGTSTAGPILAPRLWMSYLSPAIQSPLPPRSISTLCNLQYFQQTSQGEIGTQAFNKLSSPGVLGTFTFSSVTFSNVPDLIAISIRPQASQQLTNESDWCCTFPDSAIQQFTFANQSGLFSGWTSISLTQTSRNNGSRSSMWQYGGPEGKGVLRMGGVGQAFAGGSILLLRPGVDFPLPAGVAVGSTGQVQLAFQIQYNAPTGQCWAPTGTSNRTFVATVTAISSGYFVTDNGVSRQLLVGLDEATVLSAPEAPDRFMTQRLTGGSATSMAASHANAAMEALKNHFSKGTSAAVAAAKAAAQAAKSAYGHGGTVVAGAGMYRGGAFDGGAGSKRSFGESLAARLSED